MFKELLKTLLWVVILSFSIIFLNIYNAKYDTKTKGKILSQKDIIGHGEAINYITVSYRDLNDSICNCIAHSSKMYSYNNGEIVDVEYKSISKSECFIENKYIDPGTTYVLIFIICCIILQFIYKFISYRSDFNEEISKLKNIIK
jgi:hypothetical protein